jgi:hypothetical protein
MKDKELKLVEVNASRTLVGGEGRVMKDKELKLVEVNASRTLVQRGRSCSGRGNGEGVDATC